MKHILNFYKEQGDRTKVLPNTFDKISTNISEITQMIRSIGVHPCDLDKIGLSLPEERINDRYLKTVQEVINKIKILGDENRIVIICRHFSMLLTSILREQGIPARCRCGFANYFTYGWFEDHWICEYWNGNRWVRVDSQVDKVNNINFNDMDKDIFFVAGVLWKLYRQNLISGNRCGFSDESGENGEWYIRGNMVRDYFSLNKLEYTYQEINYLMDRYYQPNTKDLMLLDKIADLTINIDAKFDEYISFYKTNLKNLKCEGKNI
jgi:hypothetical protein